MQSDYDKKRELAGEMIEAGKTDDEINAALAAMDEEPKEGDSPEPIPEGDEDKPADKPVEGDPGNEPKDKPADGDPSTPGDDGEPSTDEELERLRATNATLEKQAKDNQSWGTKQSQLAAKLKEENEKLRESIPEPEIFEENPDLKGAIESVIDNRTRSLEPAETPTEESREQFWYKAVVDVHGDYQELSKDKAFTARLQAHLDGLGEEGFNPLHAIKEINAIKAERALAQREAAITTAIKNHEAKMKRNDAMNVPVDGGASSPGDRAKNGIEKINAMSLEDLRKEQDLVIMNQGA